MSISRRVGLRSGLAAAGLVALTVATVLGAGGCAAPGVAVGDTAPDFELRDQSGIPVRLYDVLEDRRVVLFFYAADATPG